MIDISLLLSTIQYILIVILLVLLIIVAIRLIKTLKNINNVVKDVSDKSSKLDGVFNAVDGATDIISSFGEKFIALISTKIFKKEKGGKKDE